MDFGNFIASFQVSNNISFSYRRRKGEKIFLVAFYECSEDYEMENVDHNRLYCSNEQWVAVDYDEDNTPKCVAVNEDDNDDEEEGALKIHLRIIETIFVTQSGDKLIKIDSIGFGSCSSRSFFFFSSDLSEIILDTDGFLQLSAHLTFNPEFI
jgi:hypothetical protein